MVIIAPPWLDPGRITENMGERYEITQGFIKAYPMCRFGHPAIEAAGRALKRAFGKPAVFIREGGSIPIIAAFDRMLKVPSVLMGVGLNDVPRGSLGHWIKIEKGKIGNYQYVVPSTWNLSGRCEKGKLSPVEEALVGTPIADPKRPLEVLRTVHSFDPCIACGVHVIDPESNQVYDIKVL